MAVSAPRSRSILAVISARGGGDWPPVLALARGLADRGHRLAVLCDAGTRSAIAAASLPHTRLPPELEQSRFFARWIQQDTPGEHARSSSYPLSAWADACLPEARAAALASQPDLIVSSLFCSPLADLLGADLGIPWCLINPSFYFGPESRRSWEEDFLEPSRSVFRDHFHPLAQRADIVLHATDPGIDFPPSNLPANHRSIGPLSWETPVALPDGLLDPGPPWILVSLSTVPQEGDLTIARGAISALADEPVRVLVTTAPEHDWTQLDPLPANVHLSGYVPHGAILPRCRLVVSHAGHGIVMKTLAHGLPMVLVPWGRDQPGVAARVEAAGAAIVVPRDRCTDERVAAAIREVLTQPRYAVASSAIAARMRDNDAIATASAAIDELLTNRALNAR